MAVTALSTARRQRGALRHRRLVDAGPIAAAFGIYLGSRVDLIPGSDCLRLLEIPDQAPASPPPRVDELVDSELGGRPGELFERFEERPFDSALLTQRHRGRLSGGKPVVVELVHPEVLAALDRGGASEVVGRLIAAGVLPGAAASMVEEFEHRLDLRRATRALVDLAAEADSRWVEVPVVHDELCSRHVRVLSAVAGGEAATAGRGRGRRLSRVWLAMALGGELFPLEPWGRNVAHLDGGRVAFLGGEAHRLPRAWQGELREYLAAVAARQPARAAEAFLDLLPEAPARRRLRSRLRHTDPFRDRGWDVGGDLFVRQVLAHWRTAVELGYRPAEGLEPFYRGLFLLNQEVRRLDEAAGRVGEEPTGVRDGLREARLLLLVGELSESAEAGRWAGALERQIGLLSGLPRKLDRILTLAAGDDPAAAEEGGGVAGEAAGRRDRGRSSRGWPAVSACLLALAAVVMLAHHVGEAAAPSAPAERLGALLVLLLGGLALRVALRSGGD